MFRGPLTHFRMSIYILGVQVSNLRVVSFFSAQNKETNFSAQLLEPRRQPLGATTPPYCVQVSSQRRGASPLPSQFAAFHNFSHFRLILAYFFLFHPKCLQNIKTSIKLRKYTTK